MKVPFVDLKAQYKAIQSEIDGAIASVIEDTAFIKGKFVEQFESEFSEYLGSKFCVGCGNGTDALEIGLKALGLGAGDEVLVPANTFIATSEAVSTTGAKPVFIDCHPDTYNMNPELLAAHLTRKTKAIIPVHLYGLPADMDPIMTFARDHDLKVIEDCAQAHGALYKGKKVGTFGDLATFSFFPGKNLGAYGDGGAIVGSDDDLHTKCRMIANHGRISKYDHEFEGRNSRLDGIQAAILSAKLKHLDNWSEARRNCARLYSQKLPNLDLELPVVPDGVTPVYHLYVVRLRQRDALGKFLSENGIDTGVHYPIPLPLLKAYEAYGHSPSDFPVSAGYMSQILSLPMFPELSESQIDFIVEKISEFLSN